jgi:hypothetical protein
VRHIDVLFEEGIETSLNEGLVVFLSGTRADRQGYNLCKDLFPLIVIIERVYIVLRLLVVNVSPIELLYEFLRYLSILSDFKV